MQMVERKVDFAGEFKSRINLDAIKEQVLKEEAELDAFYAQKKAEYRAFRGDIATIVRPEVEPVADMSNWTIPAGAKQLILENGGPLTTRQILDGMWDRGWRTKSQRPITVVHSGLAESPYIKRVGKKWDLSERGLETQL